MCSQLIQFKLLTQQPVHRPVPNQSNMVAANVQLVHTVPTVKLGAANVNPAAVNVQPVRRPVPNQSKMFRPPKMRMPPNVLVLGHSFIWDVKLHFDENPHEAARGEDGC